MAVELTDEELINIQKEALQFAVDKMAFRESYLGEIIYDLKRENLKKDLIISKLEAWNKK